MKQFKIGDILRCEEQYSYFYAYTNHHALVKVEKIEPNEISVRIIAHTKHKDRIGATYSVRPEKFNLATEDDFKAFPDFVPPIVKPKIYFKIRW